MAERVVVTDRLLKNVAPGDKRFDILDALVPGLLARVHPSGRITFELRSRIGSPWPMRRVIGQYGRVTVEQARRTARQWLELLHAGGSPEAAIAAARAEQQRARDAAAAAAANTVEVVTERFVVRKLKQQRRGRNVERILRSELLPAWGRRPVAEINHRDVRAVIDAIIERGSASYAHNVLDAAKALLEFAVDQELIEHNPCSRLKRKKIVGHKRHRERTLTDDELFALWRASGRLGYPWAGFYQLLLLTGARRGEAAGARWREFQNLDDPAKATWLIPAERFKTNQQHEIPLTTDALAVLQALPKYRRGDALFSSTFGERPINGFDKAKTKLDEGMVQVLRALARKRGNDPDEVRLEPFQVHDLRRTVRSRLSALRIRDEVAEQVIGHQKSGIIGTYNLHQYAAEKREALAAWAALLRSIVEPTPASNVVALRAKRGA